MIFLVLLKVATNFLFKFSLTQSLTLRSSNYRVLTMKTFLLKIFLLLSFFSQSHQIESSKFLKTNVKTNTNLVSAVNYVVDEVFATSITTENLISSENEAIFLIKDFKDKLLKKTSNKVAFRQENSSNLKAVMRRKRLYNILLAVSFESFMDIYEKMSPMLFRMNGYYLVILINGRIAEIHEMFKHLWKFQIFNVNVMFQDENGDVLVQTFMPFNAQSCSDTKPILINKFTDGKFINGIDNFFPQKMKNLKNCSVKVSTSNFAALETKLSDGNGQDINLINALSQNMNFTINYTFIGHFGYLLENGTAEGPLKSLMDKTADVSVSEWWLKPNRMKYFDYTTSYISDQIIFIVKPGQDLSAIERLVYPFQPLLWTSICVCFLVGIIVIFVIKLKSKKIQDFVFGTDVTNPYLKIFEAFIGVSQNKLPRRNFARFLLMIFLIYSLIIRTIYQASFYEILRSNKGYGEVQTIDEMIEKDFKFYVYMGNADLLQGTEAIKLRLIVY
jgi:Ligated ion channel L-glutamate- and glycine-binding site